MRSAIADFLVAIALVASAGAKEYILAYDGNDFPENEARARVWAELGKSDERL